MWYIINKMSPALWRGNAIEEKTVKDRDLERQCVPLQGRRSSGFTEKGCT